MNWGSRNLIRFVPFMARMTIKTLAAKGLPKHAIAWQLDLSEGTVRYHLRRQAADAADGRTRQVHLAQAQHEAIA